jgi:hypothetical protein
MFSIYQMALSRLRRMSGKAKPARVIWKRDQPKGIQAVGVTLEELRVESLRLEDHRLEKGALSRMFSQLELSL